MQLMGTKNYPVRMFSDGMDDFVIDEKTMKTTPGVAGLHSVAMTTVASAKEGDADRTYLRYCPVRAWTRLRFLEGTRDRRWL